MSITSDVEVTGDLLRQYLGGDDPKVEGVREVIKKCSSSDLTIIFNGPKFVNISAASFKDTGFDRVSFLKFDGKNFPHSKIIRISFPKITIENFTIVEDIHIVAPDPSNTNRKKNSWLRILNCGKVFNLFGNNVDFGIHKSKLQPGALDGMTNYKVRKRPFGNSPDPVKPPVSKRRPLK